MTQTPARDLRCAAGHLRNARAALRGQADPGGEFDFLNSDILDVEAILLYQAGGESEPIPAEGRTPAESVALAAALLEAHVQSVPLAAWSGLRLIQQRVQ
jgi:hypothetical protein